MAKVYFRGFAPLIAVSLAAAAPATAQMPEAAPVCTAMVAPVGALAPWAAPVDMTAGGDAQHLAKSTIALGQAAHVALLPTPDVHYSVQPEKPGGSVSHGGLLTFDIATGGAYRIALGSPAWIDVIGPDKTAVVSTAHGHGPACTGIRKMVDFTLAPGHYTLQISANGEPQTTLLIVHAS